jgi:hypothetical protein
MGGKVSGGGVGRKQIAESRKREGKGNGNR